MRTQRKESSAHWCHGSTGIALARMEWLKLDDVHEILDQEKRQEIEEELELAIGSIFKIGLNLSNFCLCHGIVGNLDVLLEYQRTFKPDDRPLQAFLMSHYKSVADFGLEKGFICGLSDRFYAFGLMTGISGIMHGFLRVLNEETPSVMRPSV